MKLLFITRKYPPMVGGMEKVSYALANEFSKKVDTTVIAWGKSQIYLPYFLIIAFFKSIWIIPTKNITNIHLGDALLAPLGFVLKVLFNKKVTVTVHGLDITYKLPIYQMIVPFFVSKLDKVICISSATLEECVKRVIPREKCTVIPWGVYPDEFKIDATRRDLEEIVGIDLEGKKVLVTVGRLVKRKGVYWFIENVFPKLGNEFVYLVVGDGVERERIEKLIRDLNFSDRIFLLGRISDHQLKIIYNTVDIFIMPNLKMTGDIEGFGVVALEAVSAGLPVIASNVDGIIDTTLSGEIRLVESLVAADFIENIVNFPKQNNIIAFSKTKNSYSWDQISNRYIELVIIT